MPRVEQGVPVTLARVAREDVPVLAQGLGTVQAWRSVTVRAQVSGLVTRVAFQEGQPVEQGDLLASIDPRPYAALLAGAQAKLAGDRADLVNAQLNHGRDLKLAQDQFGSQQQADNALSLVRHLQSNVQSDIAAAQQAQLNLDFCSVIAPFDGVIGFRLVDVGNLIENGAQTAIAVVRQVHPIAVVFALPEAQLPQVKQALKVGTPTVRAVTSSGAILDTGLLVTPDNAIDPTTGMIALKAVFVNAHEQLWPGQHIDAQLQLGIRRGALVVPSAAVQHGPDGLFVYLAEPDRTVTVRPVEVGTETAGRTVVTSGLQGGDDVVVDGQSRLQDGSRIASAAEPGR